ncbi:MAG: DUF3396 domain-containing protein [Burkholderiales bacterium]|nr:DUF3396 domain-containing protein [Burkholderiales bacterium]MDE1926268.1 DUF3396 domain-containing protein [Burkholderiales bacterium]MDE2159773.1 DUF3396 domain-containing protein [Burkholderiales bacterium]MDE2502603.1 DUF3396 domain-containing protein [Burkholderiales bacterium]
MHPNQILAELTQFNGKPCVLDKIHLPYEQANSGPATKFGLGAEFFLSDSDRACLRKRSIEFLTDFWHMFPNRIDEFVPTGTRKARKFKGNPNEALWGDCESQSVDKGYSTLMMGEVDIGLVKDDIKPYQAGVLARRSGDPRLSFVSAAMPVCNDDGDLNFDTLLSAVLRWSEICQPVHGTAGFCLIFASGMSQNTTYALQLMKRYPGFHISNAVDFSAETKLVHNRIKCANWLTVLCDDLVTELGGKERMRAALEPECRIHDYPGGAVIQAGANPQLGDTWRNDIPEAYRMVARYTRPIRFEGYTDGLFRVPDGLDDVEEALSWVRRFD